MGQYLFRLPDIGEGVAEAEIIAWHVKVGDHIKEDAAAAGCDDRQGDGGHDLAGRRHGDGAARRSGKHGAGRFGAGGDGCGGAEPGRRAGQQADAGKGSDARMPAPAKPNRRRGQTINPDPTASPATRRRAMEWGIKLEDVQGTGPSGRILTEDLERHRGATAHAVARSRRIEEIKLIGMRRKIADRMAQSKRQIPHFTYVEEFDLTELEALRADLNANRADDQPKLTLLPFFMRAMVKLLPEFPNINAHYDEAAGVLKRYAAVHIGIATQTPNGLMVPVVRHAESRDLWDCARELAPGDGGGARRQRGA